MNSQISETFADKWLEKGNIKVYSRSLCLG